MLFPWQVAVTLAAGCVTLVIACVAQTQRKILVANPFSAGCMLAALWCFLYAWMLQADSLEEKLLILKVGFSALAFLPALALEVTYRFVYERRLFRGWLLAAALVVPVMTAALAWTINSSSIFRYDCWIDTSTAIPLLRFKEGPACAIFYLYCYALAIWSFVILLGALHSCPPWVRRARISFLIARIIPMALDVLFHFDLLPPSGMNYAPASLALSDILIAFIVFGDRVGYRAYVARSTLVEKISDLLIVLDGGNRVLDLNHAAAEALGTRLEAVQGHSVEQLFVTWPAVLSHLRDRPGGEAEVERGGKYFELSIVPVGKTTGRNSDIVILWLRDITRRKQAEQDYREAAEAAKRANLAKDRYLAVMSHEIRSPLNSVLGFMRLLENTPLDHEQHEYVGHVSKNGDNLLAVINEILDFSKIEAGHMHLATEPFDVRDEVLTLCRGMELEARAKGIGFTCEVAPDVPELLVGDKTRAMQILRNLIVNAIKFTAEGSVGVQVDASAPSSTTPGCLLRLTIADTGIGIAPEELETLFQPFSQATHSTQRRYGGSGLGLVIANRFSEMMGGAITVRSTPGLGSTFTCKLLLPIGERSSAGTPNPVELIDPPAALRLLVVDDQPVNCRLLQIMLTRMSHEVVTASGGLECLELLQTQIFDALILDVEMPGLDGFETARRIRKMPAAQSIYIVALTAHASTDIREQCFAAGMNDYLSKPINPTALKKSLQLAAAFRRRPKDTPSRPHLET